MKRVDEKEREKKRNNERGERNFRVKKEGRERVKNYHFVLELSYNAILPLELHCSTIANFFAIIDL